MSSWVLENRGETVRLDTQAIVHAYPTSTSPDLLLSYSIHVIAYTEIGRARHGYTLPDWADLNSPVTLHRRLCLAMWRS
eukprot:4567228-Amphidinium_carterae.3